MQRSALSFKYAIEGVWSAFKEEPNLKIHFLVALAVIALGLYVKITKLEWIVLTIVVGVVVSVELTNTSIEWVVDSFIDRKHPGAKRAKDISAGAVLAVTIMAILVGLVIFLPYLEFSV